MMFLTVFEAAVPPSRLVTPRASVLLIILGTALAAMRFGERPLQPFAGLLIRLVLYLGGIRGSVSLRRIFRITWHYEIKLFPTKVHLEIFCRSQFHLRSAYNFKIITFLDACKPTLFGTGVATRRPYCDTVSFPLYTCIHARVFNNRVS